MDATEIPLFHGLTPQEIESVKSQCESVSLRDGETLFKEGAAGDALYLVERGKLTIAKRVREASDETISILTVGRGEFVGELAVLDDAPRASSALAAGDAALLRLSKGKFIGLMRNEPAIGSKLLLNLVQTIAKRVRQVNQELAVLFDVGRVLARGADDAGTALSEALTVLSQGLHAERSCFFGVNPVGESLDLSAAVGCSPDPLSLSLKQPSGRLSALLRITAPRIIDPNTLSELSGSSEAAAWEAASTMILPILGAETTVGYLILSRAAPPFSDNELNLVRAASLQLGQFFERAHLQQDAKLQRDIKREYFKF